MLIILIFAAILSLILNFSTASIEEYSTGKSNLLFKKEEQQENSRSHMVKIQMDR